MVMWLTIWMALMGTGTATSLAEINELERVSLRLIETVYSNPYIPILYEYRNGKLIERPSKKQLQFLAYEGKEALYGGAAAGGKSDALLMAALQYVHVPGYRAIILRRTFAHLNMDGGLIPRSKEWIGGRAHWNSTDMVWTFPSGATLRFGYYDHDDHYMRYQGGDWDFVAFDELSQFREKWYLYLFSRIARRPEGWPVPSRMRAASNPGGPGHEWVKRRFIVPTAPKYFVPALICDNPGIVAKDYYSSLAELDPITRAQLMAGDWDAYEGGRFKSEWFREFCVMADQEGLPRYHLQVGKNRNGTPIFEHEGIHVARCWNFSVCDPAARAEEANDYTAIGTFAVTPRRDLLVLDMVREKLALEKIVPRIGEVCDDFSPLWVAIEDSGFQAAIVNEAKQHALIPAVRGISPEGKGKLVRATAAIVRASEGQIFLPERGPVFPWVEEFVGELVQFTGDEDQDAHDDQVDALAYAVQCLDRAGFEAPVAVEREPEFTESQSFGGWQR